MLLAQHIGPGSLLDSYFASFGLATAVLGGLIAAATFLVPTAVAPWQNKSIQFEITRKGCEALTAFAMFAALAAMTSQFCIWIFNQAQDNFGISQVDVHLNILAWAAAFLTVITSTLNAISVTQGKTIIPIALGTTPNLIVSIFLITLKTPSILAVAIASTGGILVQACISAWITKSNWATNKITAAGVKNIAKQIPLAAAGTVCFSGYAAVDALMGPVIGESVLSHQALSQRLIISFGSVLSIGPFLRTPIAFGEMAAKNNHHAIFGSVIRLSLLMIVATSLASLLTPSIGALLIRQLFERGDFSGHDTSAVSETVRILLIGAGPMLSTSIVFRALHTLNRQYFVAAASIGWVATYAILSLALCQILQINTLSISYSLSWVALFFVALGYLHHVSQQHSIENSANPNSRDK